MFITNLYLIIAKRWEEQNFLLAVFSPRIYYPYDKKLSSELSYIEHSRFFPYAPERFGSKLALSF